MRTYRRTAAASRTTRRRYRQGIVVKLDNVFRAASPAGAAHPALLRTDFGYAFAERGKRLSETPFPRLDGARGNGVARNMKQSAPRGVNLRADNVFERPARLAVAAQR